MQLKSSVVLCLKHRGKLCLHKQLIESLKLEHQNPLTGGLYIFPHNTDGKKMLQHPLEVCQVDIITAEGLAWTQYSSDLWSTGTPISRSTMGRLSWCLMWTTTYWHLYRSFLCLHPLSSGIKCSSPQCDTPQACVKTHKQCCGRRPRGCVGRSNSPCHGCRPFKAQNTHAQQII